MSGSRERGVAADAYRMLARRPLSERELRTRLTGRGHAEGEVETALGRLRAAGYLSDEQLALDSIVARAERLGHGRLRLVRNLTERGIDERVAAAAWRRAVDQGDVDPDALLRRAIARRVGSGALDRRAYARAYNALLRAGFEPDALRSGLGPHRGPAIADDDPGDGFDA